MTSYKLVSVADENEDASQIINDIVSWASKESNLRRPIIALVAQ
jgi:hypothetical protein